MLAHGSDIMLSVGAEIGPQVQCIPFSAALDRHGRRQLSRWCERPLAHLGAAFTHAAACLPVLTHFIHTGWLADALVARGLSVTKVRKRLQTVAFLVPAVALTILVNPTISPATAVACMTAALGVSSLGGSEACLGRSA